jgi:hypothetical protein
MSPKPRLHRPLIAIVIIAVVFLFISLFGCTASISKVNEGLFENPTVFIEKVGQLKPGMSEEEFYKALDIESTAENLEFLGPEEIWPYVYGNTQPLVSLSELKMAKEDIMAPFKAIRFPYSFVKKKIGPTVGTMGPGVTVDLKGYDLRVVAIFDKGKLFRSPPEGTPRINRRDEIYILDFVEGVFRGAVDQGTREGIKALR